MSSAKSDKKDVDLVPRLCRMAAPQNRKFHCSALHSHIKAFSCFSNEEVSVNVYREALACIFRSHIVMQISNGQSF